MLSKDAFIDFILSGDAASQVNTPEESALPEGMEGFDTSPVNSRPDASFARRLLEASCFGYAELVQKDNVIRSSDAVARYLPERVCFWPKTSARAYQTLLFETELDHKALLDIPAFRGRKMSHLDIVEDALARFVSEALEGFQRGGEGVTADVRKGRKDETLCVVSIVDKRNGAPVHLVCFGTQNQVSGGLETFQISEQTKFWDPQLARDHLELLYERQFRRLGTKDWQEAFTTTEERTQAEKLLEICTRKAPKEHDIQEGVLDLLDIIAKGFGLRKRPKTDRRLQSFALPADHDIGIDPDERKTGFGGHNPFGGVILRDEKSRLLGYIVYPLQHKADATRLRKHLEKNNRFHNVLVVYPDEDQTSLELWQGTEQLTGKLRKDHGYKDAADVVNLLSRFFIVSKAKVKNPSELAEELAYRARYLWRIAVKQLEEEPEEGPLCKLYNAFKEALVHDLNENDFASAFAQSITYGLLTARWTGNDQLVVDGERFTRQSALKHLPPASPFLNDFFQSTMSVKLDEQRGRLLWLVDDMADLLDRIDVSFVFGAGDVGSDTATDPVIHFYEPFLSAYDKELKNKRGVFFTPRPVVSYIVRSIHELLQTEFKLEDGLAATDSWGEVAERIEGLKVPAGVKSTDPFICILDVATGTGTFLFECINIIENTMKDRWCRELKKKDWNDQAVVERWQKYVQNHLLQRLYGYELMMAPYAIAHLKLSLKLGQTGYQLKEGDSLNIYLTNTLEPPSDDGQQQLAGLSPPLAHEARAVNTIKRHQPFTVVIGNPPYSGMSANMSDECQRLIDAYRLVDGQPLNERKLWLQDDYVKFMRLAQVIVERATIGVFGYITNHGYLDNPTFRGMRQSFLSTFRRLWLVDLHGNTNKKERDPNGSEDKNVFDIRQGVAICLALCYPAKAEIRHHDLWGSRESKYEWLQSHTVATTIFSTLKPESPFYFFEPQDTSRREEYEAYPRITEAMPCFGLGFQTSRDSLIIAFDRKTLEERIERFIDLKRSDSDVRKEFFQDKKVASYAPGDTRQWSLAVARRSLSEDAAWKTSIHRCLYRPFDWRQILYDKRMVDWPRPEVMGHMLIENPGNLCLLANRQSKEDFAVLCANTLTERKIAAVYDASSSFPLYLRPVASGESGTLKLQVARTVNFAPCFLKAISQTLNVQQIDGDGMPIGLSPEAIFQYIYALFHSQNYRVRYAEFLKVDFPRVPLTSSVELFRSLAVLGEQLVALHLMESPQLKNFHPTYIGPVNAEVKKISWSQDTVWIDNTHACGFKNVSHEVWNFHVGGYQVCDKWLKDRKSGRLSQQDIEHYQKIVMVIGQTIRLMHEIDEVIDKHGGWPAAFTMEPARGTNA